MSMYSLKTRNDRPKDKQHFNSKALLVKRFQPPILKDCALDDCIPNSIEVMRRLDRPIAAFEHNLWHNYQRQLDQFRHLSIKC
jgi:hypothetical protein